MERSLVTVHRQMRLATQLTFSLTMLNSLLLAGVAATAIGAWSLEAVSLGAIAVAIARVLLKNAPILVLDEATSALDSEVEAAIQEQLYALMAGKTVIAIAHRLSTIAMLDRLVVIDAGRIVETGRHDELLARNGLYAALWRRQSGGFLGLGTRSGVADPQPALDG